MYILAQVLEVQTGSIVEPLVVSCMFGLIFLCGGKE